MKTVFQHLLLFIWFIGITLFGILSIILVLMLVLTPIIYWVPVISHGIVFIYGILITIASFHIGLYLMNEINTRYGKYFNS